ncbi:MAG: hypothetical protein J7513_10630 [Solirubrobacteraceae bacterium]|nr:hypothetical protein [Solirubrobacteraceae bacterium]
MHRSRFVTTLAVAAAALTLSVAAAPAGAVQTRTVDYQCKWPVIGVQPMQATFTYDYPATATWAAAIPAAPVTASYAFGQPVADLMAGKDGLEQVADRLEATQTLDVTRYASLDSVYDVDTPLTFAPVTDPHVGPFTLTGTGTSPAIRFEVQENFVLGSRQVLNLRASVNGEATLLPPVTADADGLPVSDTDGDPETFNVYCSAPSSSVASIAWDGTRPAPETNTWELSGSTTLATVTKGTMPLHGTLRGGITVDRQLVDGALTLDDTQGRLVALGILPVTATLGFVTSGPVTGGFEPYFAALSVQTKVRIKIKSLKAFGAIPLAAGNTCQTKQLTDLTLTGVPPSKDPRAENVPLKATYAISDFNGCGLFTGLISPAAAGSGNTMELTTKALPAATPTPAPSS